MIHQGFSFWSNYINLFCVSFPVYVYIYGCIYISPWKQSTFTFWHHCVSWNGSQKTWTFQNKKCNPSNLTAKVTEKMMVFQSDPSFLLKFSSPFFQGQTCCSFSGVYPPLTVGRCGGVSFFVVPLGYEREISWSQKGMNIFHKSLGSKICKTSSFLTTVDGFAIPNNHLGMYSKTLKVMRINLPVVPPKSQGKFLRLSTYPLLSKLVAGDETKALIFIHRPARFHGRHRTPQGVGWMDPKEEVDVDKYRYYIYGVSKNRGYPEMDGL